MTSSSTSTQPSTSRHRFIDVVRPTRHVLTVSVSFSSTALGGIMTRTLDWLIELIKWGLASHWTHYSSYRGRVLRVKWPNRPCQSTEGSSSPKDQASIPQGPPHHVTKLHMHAICSDTQNSVFTYTKWVWGLRQTWCDCWWATHGICIPCRHWLIRSKQMSYHLQWLFWFSVPKNWLSTFDRWRHFAL